jgi:hypothetical protein
MGFLEAGVPYSWRASRAHIAYVRAHGVEQFLRIFHSIKDREGDSLKWGDEVRCYAGGIWGARVGRGRGAGVWRWRRVPCARARSAPRALQRRAKTLTTLPPPPLSD